MKLDYLSPYTKINWEWIKDINMNIRPHTINCIEENTSELILEFYEFNLKHKGKETKVKNKCIGLYKIKNHIEN